MKKKRFGVEQIVGVLKQAEVGVPVVELIRKVGISVKYIGPAPYLAVCTSCSQQFKVSPDVTLTGLEAETKLQAEFDQHKCKLMDESQNAARIVREATE